MSANIPTAMAIASGPADALANSVKDALRSPTTTSTSTLKLLRALLGLDGTTETATKANPKLHSPTRPSEPVQKRSRTLKSQTKAQIVIHEAPETNIPPLSNLRRARLATETFNTTLKILNDAAKEKEALPGGLSYSYPLPRPEPLGSHNRGPLQSFSPNRGSEPSLAKEIPRRPSAASSSVESGLVATAECARSALSELRRRSALEKNGLDAVDLQLEQGALTLLSKLQLLRFNGMAEEELYLLREQIDLRIRTKSGKTKRRDSIGKSRASSPGNLASLLKFDVLPSNADLLNLVMSFQIQVLKIAALQGRAAINQSLVEALRVSNGYCPCGIILHGYKLKLYPPEKAAQRLLVLSQTLCSLCPTNFTSALPLARRPSSPEVAFEVQASALEARCHSFTVTRRVFEVEKNIWVPFGRYLSQFEKSDPSFTGGKYFVVRDAVQRMKSIIGSTLSGAAGCEDVKLPSSLVGSLAKLAQDNGCTADSLRFLQESLEQSNCSHTLSSVMSRWKIATLRLHGVQDSPKAALIAAEEALACFQGPMKGSAADLEAMLLQGVRLRKAAGAALSIIEKVTEVDPLADTQRRLRVCSTRLVFAFTKFIIRFLGYAPDGKSDSASVERYRQKLRLVRSIAETTVVNSIGAARLVIDHSEPPWHDTDTALKDCLALTNILDVGERLSGIVSGERASGSSIFVKISNLYFSQYLKGKERATKAIDLLELLRTSTSALEARPHAEKHQGLLAIKYEKMATIYVELQLLEEARNALRKAIIIHLETSGAFRDLATKSSPLFTNCFWKESTSEFFALGKMLHKYVKLSADFWETQQSHYFFYDSEGLLSKQRAVLLEKQFLASVDMPVTDAISRSIAALAKSIMCLYEEDGHPIDRIHFLHSVMTWMSKQDNTHLNDFFQEQLENLGSQEDKSSSGKEPDLTVLGTSLLASLRLRWSLHISKPSVQLLRVFINVWSPLIAGSQLTKVMVECMEEPDLLFSPLQTIIGFTDMQGLAQIKLQALLLMQGLLEQQKEKDYATLIGSLTQIGQQQSHLGSTIEAGRAFAHAEKWLKNSKFKSSVSLQYQLAYAEYLLDLANFEKCSEALSLAQRYYDADLLVESKDAIPQWRLSQDRFLLQSTLIASRMAFERGDFGNAVLLARQSVKLSSKIWTAVEKLSGFRHHEALQESAGSACESLAEDLSNMAISKGGRIAHTSSKGGHFWPYISGHFHSLLHISTLSAHCGLFQDAVYYGEQAQKVGHAIDSDVCFLTAETLIFVHKCLGEALLRDEICLGKLQSKIMCQEISLAVPVSLIRMAHACIAINENAGAFTSIQLAEDVLSRLNLTSRLCCLANSNEGNRIEEWNSTLIEATLDSGAEVLSLSTAWRRGISKTLLPPSGAKQESRGKRDSTAEPYLIPSAAILRLQANIDTLKAQIKLNSGDAEGAIALLARSGHASRRTTNLAQNQLIEAHCILDQTSKSLSTNGIECVLAETTIALPSHNKSGGTTGNLPVPPGRVQNKAPTRKKGVKQAQTRVSNLVSCSEQPQEPIARSADSLLDIAASSLSGCPTSLIHGLSKTLNRCCMLSSVISPLKTWAPVHVACYAAASTSIAMAREKSAILADKVLTDKSLLNVWPDPSLASERIPMATLEHPSMFQIEILDVLPPSWSIISMSVSHDYSELLISKLHTGQTPFLLRIALRRSSSDESASEDFDFEAAKCELRDIVSNANLSAHDARGQSDKQAKKAWWAEREGLDHRLKTLLENIENIWLGGFRGVLSPQQRNQELLSRFSESLSSCLSTHLSSRHRAGRSTHPVVQLHAHVLELFTALGHPDERELDDSIADLLYFVVDILQFEGERNAYDEIDFDMMTMEVMDALRSYHEAQRTMVEEEVGHVILILDKELIGFPWESMPCLEGKSVSRMPSLQCLKSRLDKVRAQSLNASTLRVSANAGAYILNPSSDLTSTQSTFEAVFATFLPNFTSIVNRNPTEAEFEACLQGHELLLYFGHGSGAQYIRSRTIKRLDRCAVTFLMGCSSGKMVECGQFEPYGVPWNYMHAGAPAVVGTLWDVTDRDIDRFAASTLTGWGLLSQGTVEVQRKERRDGKVGEQMENRCPEQQQIHGSMSDKCLAKADGSRKGAVALDEAVARARASCILRYLTGAAPVVYGIPVTLAE